MRVLSVASVLVTLVFCTAEDVVPRWSKPDERSQGEWVPLKSDRISQQTIRIPSAITSPRHNQERSFPHQSSANHLVGDYSKQQMLASHTAPQRIAFVNPQNLGQPQILQPQLQQQLQRLQQQIPTQLQPQLQQLDSQQLLTQFLNQQIQQASLPIFNRALLQKQAVPNPEYFSQPNQFNVVPTYNQGQLIRNEQYAVRDEREYDGKELTKDDTRQSIPDNSYEKLPNTKYIGEPFRSNLSSIEDQNQKEEIQILYVPVEMLKQQEQNIRSKNAKKIEQNQPLTKDSYNPEQRQINPEVLHTNQKESRKFRHPIQPLKDQVPAYHLKQSITPAKAVYTDSEAFNEESKEAKPLLPNQDYNNRKSPLQSRKEYIHKYNTGHSNLAASITGIPGNKEQNVDESTVKDEISDYRNTEQERNTHQDYNSKPEPSLPPPNQPPLSVFMEKTTSNRIADLITLLRGSKTIPVLDSIGPDSPQVFVGPSNLHTPSGYIKYELPYLSSLDNYQTGNKLSQVPFFVAPLNFQPPPGFAKIPFPPPHIGSVVLSNITQEIPPGRQVPSTQSSLELRTSNYNKDSFTIPADISSISPQLPSLINSLQEEEYSSSSSTEALIETTEAPQLKQRRPVSSRRFNSRGSQRGSVSYASTTKRPASRQRRPLNRNSNYRTNSYPEVAVNPETPTENHYDAESNYFHYKQNKDTMDSAEKVTTDQKLIESPQFTNEERHITGIQYPSTIENTKQEKEPKESNKPGFVDQNPTYISKFSNDGTVTTPERTLNTDYYSPEIINQNVAHSATPQYHDSRSSGETYDDYHTTNLNDKSLINNLTPADKQYPSVTTTRKYDESPIYHQGTHSPLPYTEESSIASDYEDVNYRKRFRDNINKPPANNEQNYNYRQKEQKVETPHILQDADYPREALNKENINLRINTREQEQQQQQPIEHTKNFNSPYSSYASSNEEQNTTPFIPKTNYESLSQETLDPYRNDQSSDKQLDDQKKYNYHDSSQVIAKNEDYNERSSYDLTASEPQKPTTERTFPTRSRSRGRGRPYHQYKQPSTETPVSLNSNEESDETYHYSKSDVTTSSPGRRYSHGRTHRRPLRPTVSTTTTTTKPPSGTKYLIRTRRPTVPQTKLHTGRGRIRRPTTPTTTIPTTTTEHLQTLPILWQQPHRLSPSQSDYRLKEDVKNPQSSGIDSTEYVEEMPQYSDERTSDKSTYEVQNERSQYINQGKPKQYSETEAPRRVPNYPYETQEEHFPPQKPYRTTQQPYYSDDYETTPKTHYSRNYDTTQKQQYFRNHETTQKPHYSKEYETTQKPQYSRDYETTQKTQFFIDYETTQKPQYSKDRETTPNQQYFRDHETTQKPQYYREYETTQKPSQFRTHESNSSPKFYNDYDTTKKAIYSSDYETTEKPSKGYSDDNYYDTTKKPVNYQDYETTPRPFASDADTNQKQSYGHTLRLTQRTSNFKRKPSGTTKTDSPKQTKKTHVEEPTKNQDSDYWNQAVTIQQSQSYVFNPDETYSDERPVNSPKDSKYEPSQNDYDDYYNTQESGQYTSDQSPFPSNEQRITYTQIKASDYTGKASQYPTKEDIRTEEDTIEEERDSQQTDFSTKNKLNKTGKLSNDGLEIKYETTSPEYEANLSAESEELQQSSKAMQGNKRKGTWVRRRIKKPKDLFETAESQRFDSVRENSLLTQINPKEQEINNYTANGLSEKQKDKNQKENDTSLIGLNVEESDSKDRQSSSSTPEQKILTETKEKSSINKLNDFVIARETTTEITTEKEEEFNSYLTPSITTMSVKNDEIITADTLEPYRTSTTTEISLETEICYKGQCIKTKRKKGDGETISIPTIKT